MPMLKEREYRDFALSDIVLSRSEEGENEQFVVEGYAMKWSPYVLYEDTDGTPVYEQFERSCFEGCDLSDVIFQENHTGSVLARTRNKTLEISFDDIGMYIRANLGFSQKGRDLYEAIRNGLMDRMSWGFIPGEYKFDKLARTFIHKSIKKTFDVSAVSLPANDNTIISSVRSICDGEIAKMTQELREHEETIKRIELKAKIQAMI